MAAVVVKNTFWEVVSEEDEDVELEAVAAAPRRRCRTEELPRGEAPASEYLAAQACRLCALLRPKTSPGAPCRCRAGGEAAPERPAKGTAFRGLKPVTSNSSVSTMAPADWDALPEEEEREQQDRGEPAPEAPRRRPPGQFQHAAVPRRCDFAAAADGGAAAGATTMMLRNIPNRYAQKELISEIESLGFANSFDFFYAPMDTGSMGCVGYAFINFVDAMAAARFLAEVPGHVFRKHQQRTRTKSACVSVAHLQGLAANLRHYQGAAVSSRGRARRPVVMPHLTGLLQG